MSELTDEQLRGFADYPVRTIIKRMATELLALRTLGAKTMQSDEERARVIADMFLAGDEPIRSQIADVAAILASIRAEGSAERAKLEAALREISREQSAKTPTEAADKFQGIARAAINWKPVDLAQPAESGATICIACARPVGDRQTYIPTAKGPMHPSCWESAGAKTAESGATEQLANKAMCKKCNLLIQESGATEQWPPADCYKPSSCDRNGACMYVPCVHAGQQRAGAKP